MPTPDPAQRLARLSSDLDELRRDTARLLQDIRLSDPLEDVSRRQAELPKLRSELERLHARKYVWTAAIVEGLSGLEQAGTEALRLAREESARVHHQLQGPADALNRKVGAMRADLAFEPMIVGAGAERDGLEAQVRAAVARVEALTNTFRDRHDTAERALVAAHANMDRFESATFAMLPEENPLASIAATWEDSPEGEKEGILFLTDLRIRFEGRTEVATKKFLFFTTESETVKKVLLDEAVGHVADSTDSKRGLVLKDQLLKLTWVPDAGVRGNVTTFELDGATAAEWDTLVEEVRSGAHARRRYVAGAPAGAPVIAAPAGGTPVAWADKCTACAAPLPAPVKGQTSIACPYCGQGHPVTVA